jgi:hypothetical protein
MVSVWQAHDAGAPIILIRPTHLLLNDWRAYIGLLMPLLGGFGTVD